MNFLVVEHRPKPIRPTKVFISPTVNALVGYILWNERVDKRRKRTNQDEDGQTMSKIIIKQNATQA